MRQSLVEIIARFTTVAMNYAQEEQLDIGRRIYNNEITRYEAAEEYGISGQTTITYMRLYRAANHLPPKNRNRPHVPTPAATMEAING